jgi:hypothetical protein
MNGGVHDHEPEMVGEAETVAANGTASMSTLKRWIALGAAVVVAAIALGVFGALSFAVRESGDGADPDEAFSATELVPNSLAASVEWVDDAPDLAREFEPATRDAVTAAWLRANDALMRAADGDVGGLDVWFTGPALTESHRRFARDDTGRLATGASMTSSPVAMAHELGIEFYSLDGQIIVLRTTTTFLEEAVNDVRAEVILVLADGNWRVRNIERLDAAP